MVVLRSTAKLLASLPTRSGPVAPSDTALGDWYVNRLVVDRQPLLLLLSSRSLLAVLTPARAVRTLPSRLPALIAGRLQRLGVAPQLIDAEIRAMTPVVVAKTDDSWRYTCRLPLAPAQSLRARSRGQAREPAC